MTMREAWILDAVRTPRGRGKKDGALHEVSTVKLAAHVLEAIRDRNRLDTALVDDVVLGCVDPVGEAGGDIARSAVFTADYPHSVAGLHVNRYCASGLDAINLAHAAVSGGHHDLVVAGGVESMSRVGIGSAGRQALSQILVQEYVEDEYRGRVMAVFMMQFSLMSLGTLLVSIYMEAVGPEFAIGSLGAFLITATLVYLALVPRLRQLD